MRLQAEATAKVNRELRVGSLQPDGFHQVVSRIVSIDLADSIEVESGTGGLEFSCDGDAPADDTNLVARAARLLAVRLQIAPDARIQLKKVIPAGSGLGGGSADAAAALVLLSRLWDARLPVEELASLGAELGSDVPFFLYGGEATVTGRGERVRPLSDEPRRELLLLIPPFATSTARVYAAHRRLVRAGTRLPESLEVESSGKFFGPNDLASAVLETDVRMKAFLESAREVSVEFGISGSGSAIALRGASPGASDELERRHPGARLIPCGTLTREEYQRQIGFSGGW